MTLWLIGMGISVHFNRPGRPTDNASVERMQGVSANWSEALKAPSLEVLQQRLDHVALFQRQHFPSRTCEHKTRIEAYPELRQVNTPFSHANFNFERVQTFVQLTIWKRKVSKTGRIHLFNKGFQIGYDHAKQWVVIKYDKEEHQWQIFDNQGKQIRSHEAHFCAETVQKLEAFQKKKPK